LTFGGAYNDAKYLDWSTATCPVERNVPSSTTVCNNTGRQVIAAPKFSAVLGLDYLAPVSANYSTHAWFTNSYRTSQNLTDTLSAYGVQAAYSISDIGLGLVTRDGKFEADIVAKNAFDTKYTTSITPYSSTNGVAYDGIGPRRWIGVRLHAKL
jgi:iron complex outermembrane receptor protein